MTVLKGNKTNAVETLDVPAIGEYGDELIVNNISSKLEEIFRNAGLIGTYSGVPIYNNKVYFARENEDVIIPSKESENAGLDIYAYFPEDEFIFQPHQTRLVPTGLHSAVVEDYVLLGRERGSTGSIGMKLGACVIDSGYRGEIFIAITNENEIPLVISKAVKKTEKSEDYILYPYIKGIAQLLVVPVPKLEVEEIPLEVLKAIPSKRGEGKLGSSNK